MLPIIAAASLLACLYLSAATASEPPPAVPPASAVPPALGAWLNAALERHPALAAAQAAVAAAEARVRASDQPIHNPSLTLEAERGETGSAALGLSQTLDWSDRRGAERELAVAGRAAAAAERAIAREALAAELLSAWSRLRTGREQQRHAAQRTQLMREFADTAARRHAAGDISEVEATLARLAFAEAQAQQAQLDGAAIEAETALRGLTATEGWPAEAELAVPPPATIDLDAVTAQSPALRRPLAELAAAQARSRLAASAQRPDPSVSLRGGRDGDAALIGVGLEIPLFVRRGYRAELEAAGHELAAARERLADARRRVRAAVEGALARHRAAAAAWAAWQAAGRPALTEQAALLQRLWEAGELSAAEYLMQARQVIDSALQAAELRGAVEQAAIAWLHAAGGLPDRSSPSD